MNYLKTNILFIIICINFALTDFISEQKALNISENFFYYKNNRSTINFEYETIQMLNHNNRDIFYVINKIWHSFFI